MAGYNQLKASIASVIKTNNAREITGQLLQNVLNQMVGVIGENLQLAGFADPTTNPGQPDQNIFYIAEQEGVYSHFNNTVLEGGLSFLMWKDGNWSSHTMQVVTEEYIKNHYVSIDFFRSIFCVYDENGNEILPNNEPDPILGTQEVIDNIKAQVGLWTEYYLSALGRATGGGGGGGATSLDQLSDVTINGTPTNGQALVYNSTTQMWENQTIQAGTDMASVWAAFAAPTNEQINISHLTDALQNYLTQTASDQRYITIAYFDRLFRAYNGDTLVSHNDTTTTIDNIKAMFGFWTDMYLSALGRNSAATGLGIDNLTDVTINTPTDGQVLQYNATSSKWENATIQTIVALSGLTDVLLTTPADGEFLMYDSSEGKWVNMSLKTINSQSLIGTGDISVGGGASGNYLPLTGGTLTNASFGGALTINRSTADKAAVIRYSNSDGVLGSLGFDASGAPCYYLGSSSSTEDKRLLASQSWADGKFLPLAGGTMTGDITMTANTLSNSTKIKWGGSYLTGNSNSAITARLSGTASFTARPLSNTSLGLYVNSEKVNIEHVLNVYGVDAANKRGIRLHPTGNISCIYFGCTTDDGDDAGMWTLDLHTSYGIRFRGMSSSSGTSRSNYMVIAYGGNVGIGVTSPSYKLDVDGTIYASGAITALSDARKKDITGEAGVSVEQIAHAPAVQFLWKDKERRKDGQQVGTLAQYWQTVLPEVVMDKGGELSMQYGVAALVSAITIARKVVDHERRIAELEKENEELKKQLNAA